MESQCFSDESSPWPECLTDELSISTDNDKRVSKIEIVVDLKNYRDESLKHVCMTVFGVFSAYAIATVIMNVHGRY